ncbi:MAG: Tellurite resistance protein TerB [Chitinispirillia bacterium]|jgi:hypothetical protein
MINFTKSKTENLNLTAEEAFAAITLIAMNIDGINHKMEFKIIGMVLDRMRLYKHYDEDSLRKMLRKLHKMLMEKGVETLYNSSIAQIPDDLRVTAYAVAIDIIIADDRIVEQEKSFLEMLAESLKIPVEMTNKIIEVMQIRYRG